MLRAGVCVLAFAALLAACDPAQVAPPSDEVGNASGGDVPGDVLSGDEAPAYVGTWAPDAAGCAIPQEAQGAPHIFTADGFDQHEAHCSFSSVVATGDDAWRVGASCTVEGDEQNTAFDLTLDGDILRIADGPPLKRCP